jgi:hypothetical protein
MKLIRMPCVPRSQSRASAHVSKSASSVNEHDNDGSREAEMGENRVSSKAEVSE